MKTTRIDMSTITSKNVFKDAVWTKATAKQIEQSSLIINQDLSASKAQNN